jgi:hypothetical protein
MPSTFTTNTGIEKIADGEQTGTWGDTTNDNFDIVDRALNGSVSITLSGTTGTVTTSDGILSDGQYAVLIFSGSPSGTNTVTIAPNTAQKTYLVRNTTAQSVVLTQGSGGNVTVPAGRSAAVYADGGGATAAVVDISAGLVPVLTNAGVTSSTAELNILDGVTATTAELNILDGVTSTTAELNILDGVTATTAELNILDGVTATTAELNILDGVTASTAELNFVDGVTSNVQTQLNAKQALNARLTEVSGLAVTDGNFIVGNGSAFVAEAPATALLSLGVTSTAAELNILDGVTATTSELNLVDGSVAGTIVNSKAVVYGAAGQVNATTLQIAGVSVTSTAAELNILDGVTATAAELNFVDGVTSNVQTQLNTKAANATAATAGNGLTGGGTLNAAFTMTLGTPSTLTSTSTNAVTSTSHTHDIDEANIVANGMAGLAYGAIGTYAFLAKDSGTTTDAGVTAAASTLIPMGIRDTQTNNAGNSYGPTRPSGTWRCMGDIGFIGAQNGAMGTLWLRIS